MLLAIRPLRTIIAGKGLHMLRPYQESCVQACLHKLKETEGVSRIGVSLPTGSGKTTVFLTLASRLPSRSLDSANRVLVIVNSVELARQTAAQAEQLLPHLTVEIEQGSKYQASGFADITIATYQTLLRPQRLKKFDASHLKAIIVDEAHHAASPSYRQILSYFEPAITSPSCIEALPKLRSRSAIPIIGFSATFSRHDGISLGEVFQHIVYHRDLLDMIKEQWLCNVKYTTVRSSLGLKNVQVSRSTGDFNANSLAEIMNTTTINILVLRTWLDLASCRKSTLIFCANLKHVQHLTEAFRAAGVDARYVHGGTPARERKGLLQGFRDRMFPVLVNCAILTEGADVPGIDCLIIARPTRSNNLFAQMIGRGMRQSPGKIDCHVIDFADSANRAPTAVTIPTLLGLSQAELDRNSKGVITCGFQPSPLIDAAWSEPVTASAPPPPPPPHALKLTFSEYRSPFTVSNKQGSNDTLLKTSPFAWIHCTDSARVLECLGLGFIRIDVKNHGLQRIYEGCFTSTRRCNQGSLSFGRKRSIVVANSLTDAVKACDTYVRRQVLSHSQVLQISRTAAWRAKPASKAQRAFLMKRFARWSPKRKAGNVPQETFNASLLTMGQAADMITRLKHGAQKQFVDNIKRAVTKMHAYDKHTFKTGVGVKVGPLVVN